MHGNICPQCGKDVMPYVRFLREAEPYKISRCSSCNTPLKRDQRVYFYLVIMILMIVLVGAPLYVVMVDIKISFAVIWGVLIFLLTCWVFLTNYLSWRYIPWTVAESKGK